MRPYVAELEASGNREALYSRSARPDKRDGKRNHSRGSNKAEFRRAQRHRARHAAKLETHAEVKAFVAAQEQGAVHLNGKVEYIDPPVYVSGCCAECDAIDAGFYDDIDDILNYTFEPVLTQKDLELQLCYDQRFDEQHPTWAMSPYVDKLGDELWHSHEQEEELAFTIDQLITEWTVEDELMN